ncbi:hypothetical protein ACROYT_G014494 [Oculina patagonica]
MAMLPQACREKEIKRKGPPGEMSSILLIEVEMDISFRMISTNVQLMKVKEARTKDFRRLKAGAVPTIDSTVCYETDQRERRRQIHCYIVLILFLFIVPTEWELRESIEEWNGQKIEREMLQDGCKWIFQPPTASSMYGMWERMVQSAKTALKAII